MWCNISGEAAGENWNWSLLGVNGLRLLLPGVGVAQLRVAHRQVRPHGHKRPHQGLAVKLERPQQRTWGQGNEGNARSVLHPPQWLCWDARERGHGTEYEACGERWEGGRCNFLSPRTPWALTKLLRMGERSVRPRHIVLRCVNIGLTHWSRIAWGKIEAWLCFQPVPFPDWFCGETGWTVRYQINAAKRRTKRRRWRLTHSLPRSKSTFCKPF